MMSLSKVDLDIVLSANNVRRHNYYLTIVRVDTPNLPVVQYRYQIWYRIMYRIRSPCFVLCQFFFIVLNFFLHAR